jgi:murein L,D-transpeptidase YcbB/YkuD
MRNLCLVLMLSAAPLVAASTLLAQPGSFSQATPTETLTWSRADAAMLLAAIGNAGAEGLDAADYRPSNQSDAELTRVALAYLSDLRGGRAAPRSLDRDVQLPDRPANDAVDLANALKQHRLGSLLAAASPPHPAYQKLKAGLAFYEGISKRGGWARLPERLDWQHPGAGALLLRDRLAAEDRDPVAGSSAGLVAALRRFQERHGLVADGRLGAATLVELNVTADARVSQVLANMERWRWLPDAFEQDYITINVPDASLGLVLNGSEMLRSRVVVGKPRSPTPILRAEGAGITVNPPWNVPASIARKEILPKLKANPAYLRTQDMVLLDGPAGDPYGLHVRWHDIPAGTFPYRVQQHPGRTNALGTVKIELPNRFNVYLHDTPAKGAFANRARDISHGCVRVERILPLASYALSESLDAMTVISNAIASGQTEYFPLKRRLPVYFLYWTVFPAADGTLQFRPDIYGRDRRLIAALQQPQAMRVSANFPNCSRG